MKKCKITVLKKYFDKELSQQYGVDGLTACPMLKEGQEFYADWECPWKAVYQYVFALSHGIEDVFYYGDCIKEKGVAKKSTYLPNHRF